MPALSVARECRAAGGAYLRLSVDTDSETAKAFYEKLGIGRSDYEQVQRIVAGLFLPLPTRLGVREGLAGNGDAEAVRDVKIGRCLAVGIMALRR
ncbi:hypothetical protein [Mesorhizobium sanjuanii]|uniref:hypothetical protein n=1 Tax=Mesorhizobium sanjuanii TaxID=2037900 RepID=UPI0026BFE26D